MWCLCFPSYHTIPTLDILCCVLCCVYVYAKLCVRGRGAHMHRHGGNLVRGTVNNASGAVGKGGVMVTRGGRVH